MRLLVTTEVGTCFGLLPGFSGWLAGTSNGSAYRQPSATQTEMLDVAVVRVGAAAAGGLAQGCRERRAPTCNSISSALCRMPPR